MVAIHIIKKQLFFIYNRKIENENKQLIVDGDHGAILFQR
jgi:hypothetical protein